VGAVNLLLGVLTMLSCAGYPDGVPPAAPDTSMRALTRASLDLRGVRPSLVELQTVRDDPGALDDLVEIMVQDERFGDRYAELMASVWLTPTTESDHGQATYPVTDVYAMLESIGQEPLRLIGHVAAEDLPFTEVVTADWSVIDHHLAEFYPTDYPAGETGWRVVHYTDDRPAAGILATNGLWWRYDSTQSNANRGRANAVSRTLLCHDFLEQEIAGDRDLDLLDEDAVATAVQEAPACVACHATLDPLASYFWGFYNHFNFSPAEQSHYHPERELDWEIYGGSAPSYPGAEGGGLRELGLALAQDPRFIECAVERTWEQLMARPAGLGDIDTLSRHREAFLEGGLTARSLVASIIEDPAYQAIDPTVERALAAKLVTPDLFAAELEDLTGYRFTSGDRDAFATDLFGMRTMAGGLGAGFDIEAVVAPTPTTALVVERIAQAAAWHVAAHDLAAHDASSGDAVLLTRLQWDETPSENASRFNAQLRDLHLRVLSRDLADDAPRMQDARALWTAVEAAGGSKVDAWAAVLTWMFRDPDFLIY
jgi:hypothetical protein